MNIIFKNKKFDSEELDELLTNYYVDFSKVKSIAVIMKRSPQMLWLLYKAFCSGITYIPIDPSEPVDKVNFILNQTQPDIVLCEEYKYNYSKTRTNDYDNVGYILYTSGTTGSPKGVLINKESLVNFIDGVSEIIDFSERKKIASFTSMSFDIFFLESVMAIIKNMTIVLADEYEQKNPRAMSKLIYDSGVDMLQLTPSRLQLLLNYDRDLCCLKNIKEIMIGGEPLSITLLQELQRKTEARIYNMYGPTEATIWSTIGDLTNSSSVNIGYPIKNTEIYIVDNDMNILPVGKKGEICIAGKGLAKGYHQKDVLTAEKFVCLQNYNKKIVYKTGDIGKQNTDGTFECFGRVDNQIKLRGHRIELEEIEAILNQYIGITCSLVCVHVINDVDKLLHVFYTGDKDIIIDDIKNYLNNKLSSYMVPDIYERIDDFVLTINGKIDRKYYDDLLNSKTTHYNEKTLEMLLNIKEKIIRIIKENTSGFTGEINETSSFKELGYDSISFIKTILAIEDGFGFEFDDEYIIISKYQCIGDMVDYVIKKAKTNVIMD